MVEIRELTVKDLDALTALWEAAELWRGKYAYKSRI